MKNKGEILAEILKSYKECYFFLHNTKEFINVENIMNEGFIFESQLPHSTDRVNPNDPVEITYFFFQRKEYGSYTIVLAIPKDVYDKYSAVSVNLGIEIEDLITITEPFYGENDELIYTVSPKHVLGYFSLKTTEFYKNKNWDPFFNNCISASPKPKLIKPGKK